MSARQLEHPAQGADAQGRREMGFGSQDAFGALDPRLGLVRLSLPGEHECDYQAGHPHRRVVGPAVLFGQLHCLPAVFGRAGERVVELVRGLVGQAGELQVGPPALAGQRDAAFQAALGLLGRGRPELGAAQADQRQRAQVRAQAGPRRRRHVVLRRVRDLGHGRQPLRLFGHAGRVPALDGQLQPDHSEQQPQLATPGLGCRRRRPFGQAQVSLRGLQRPLRQLIGRGRHREPGIRRPHPGGEPREELVNRGAREY